MPRLVTLLRGLGIDISKREVVRLLTAGHDGFGAEARDVLRAGLASAAWITVDDTGARHKTTNGFCTQIGNPATGLNRLSTPEADARSGQVI